jgi:flagellar motor protein MotB
MKLINKITKYNNDDHGYLSSISDLMAGLLFIFIIILNLYLINLLIQNNKINSEKNKEFQEIKLKYEKETTNTQNKSIELELEIKTVNNRLQELTDANDIRAKLLQILKQNLEKKGIIINIIEEDGILRIPENILFPSGSATFTPEGETSLSALTDELTLILPCYCGKKNDPPPGCKEHLPGRLEVVLIEGHTDDVKIVKGPFLDNWDLSSARSLTTFRYMMNRSNLLLELKNMSGSMFFGTSAYADTRPAQSNETEEGRAANRRIDLRFLLAAPVVVAPVVDKIK